LEKVRKLTKPLKKKTDHAKNFNYKRRFPIAGGVLLL